MKCLATFIGRVTCILSGGNRRVELYRIYKKGEEPIIADMNRGYCKGYEVGQEFSYKVMKEKGKPAVSRIKKLRPKRLSKKQVARIVKRIEKTLSGIDFL